MRQCAECGTATEGIGRNKRVKKVFCSTSCRTEHFRKIDLTCAHCGKTFLGSLVQKRRVQGGGNAYCCNRCQADSQVHTDGIVFCSVCGKQFRGSAQERYRLRNGGKAFCSDGCKEVARVEMHRGRAYDRNRRNLAGVQMLNLGCPWAEGRVRGYDRQVAIW